LRKRGKEKGKREREKNTYSSLDHVGVWLGWGESWVSGGAKVVLPQGESEERSDVLEGVGYAKKKARLPDQRKKSSVSET